MAAVLTGTPVAVTWAAGANPAGQSITIPSDATAVYMFWAFYTSADGNGLASVTLGGNNPAQTFETPTAAVDQTGTGVAAWYNPATGSQTLDPAWDAAPEEGATCIVAFVKDGDTTAWRDADADNQDGTTACSVTLTTVSGDLVIKFDQRFSGTAPALSSGWTNGQTHSNNSEGARLSYISATGTTQVCASEDDNYSSVVAISIPAASGSSAISGSAAIVFGAGSSALTGSGGLAGSSANVFGAGSSSLTGTGALAGSSAVVFGAGNSTLSSIGALAGSGVMTFGDAAALTGAGALAGAAAVQFADAAALTGSGTLAGVAALAFAASLATNAGDVSGASALTFSNTGVLTGVGALVGNASLSFSGAAQTTSGPARRRGVARGYIIKGKRYFLTNEQLAYMLARELIDVGREDIKVKYKTGKPHIISQNTWAELRSTLSSLEKLATTPEPETYDESDDEDAILLLL